LEIGQLTAEISAEKMAIYRETARRRRQKKDQALALRYERAWAVARQASQILKAQFGADKVVAFGSLLSTKRFHQHSDVDLAVWGLDEKSLYRAVSRLLDLDSEISIDLVEVEFASPAVQAVIKQEGVPL
jgi:predicted nucleotidyltransferase